MPGASSIWRSNSIVPTYASFRDDLPKDQDEKMTLDLIAQGLLELGNHAKGSGVKILLESHGKVVSTERLLSIMRAAEHPQVGLIWDVYNMWSVTKEAPKMVHQQLKKYICHVHLKDARQVRDKHEYVLLGEGEAPLTEAIRALTKDKFAGYYSFEWEKMWHPEIAEPEVAIPHYAKAVRDSDRIIQKLTAAFCRPTFKPLLRQYLSSATLFFSYCS
nr:sugar phosphate isomerase/epimerase family protein [Haliscomenobacter sp.]